MSNHIPNPGSDLGVLQKTYRLLTESQILRLNERDIAVMNRVNEILATLQIDGVSDAVGYDVSAALVNFQRLLSEILPVEQI